MNKLKDLRIEKGLTQDKLSEDTGLSRSMLYYLETGKRPMRLQHAKVLAPYFGVSIDYIMGTDAIYFAGSFEDALGNLISEVFDDMVSGSIKGELSERTRLLYSVIQKLLDGDMSINKLRLVNTCIDELLKTQKGE